MRQLNFEKAEYDPTNLTRCLPECCFLEAGIVSLSLPPDFTWIGLAACERCLQLQSVDLSRTEISKMLGSTFAAQFAFATAQSFQQVTKDRTRSVSQMHFATRGAYPANLAVYCSTSLCGLHATLHTPQNLKRERLGGGHTLRLMPLTNVDNWTYQSGFTSFRQTPIAVVTCGLITSMRNCARTYISFAKPCQELRLAPMCWS